jgi:hypothetical protein
MSDPYYVLVAGSGETSRANVEALMDDHYYANGAAGTLVLAFEGRPSQGQVYAAQFAKDRAKNITVFCTPDSETNAITNTAQFNRVENPVVHALELIEGKTNAAFLLWNDDDEKTLELLEFCTEDNIPCFDLTDGLMALGAPKTKSVKTVMPDIEATTSDSIPFIPDYVPDVDEEEDEAEEDEEEDFEETIMDAMYSLARMIAATVVEQLTEDFDVKPKGKK